MGGMRIIKKFLVFSMTAFHFSIMSGCIWENKIVTNTQFLSGLFKKCQFVFLTVGKTIGKFKTVICLDAFDFYT